MSGPLYEEVQDVPQHICPANEQPDDSGIKMSHNQCYGHIKASDSDDFCN